MSEPLDACPLAPSLEPLTGRVCALEELTGQLKADVAGVKTQVEGVKEQIESVATKAAQVSSDTAVIRAAIVGATRFGTFAKRHGRALAGCTLGIAIGSGFFSEATVHKLRIALMVIIGH